MRKYLLLLPFLASACLETTGLSISSCPGPAAGGICGVWIADSMVPGASLILDLQLGESAVSGSGTYSIEAGPSGRLSLTGVYRPPQVTLTLRYDDGRVSTFSGTVSASHQMVGTLTNAAGESVSQSFSSR